MIVSKKPNTVLNSHLLVDNWNIKYIKNKNTSELELVEEYDGRIQIEQTDKQKYLGFIYDQYKKLEEQIYWNN